MRIALISDIHANSPALQAVLSDITKKHAPDQIISLGDQINLGPDPLGTLDLLRTYNVTCLQGNHEGYALSAMRGEPVFTGANFDILRRHIQLVRKEDLILPKTMEVGCVTLCHAMPHDDRFPVWNPEKAIPLLRGMTFDKPTHIICGHGHNPTHFHMGQLSIDVIGSVGCMDDAPAGQAPYTILHLEEGCAVLHPYFAEYDTSAVLDLFRSSGFSKDCPITARIVCMQMMQNTDYLLPFAGFAGKLSRERGETVMSEETWRDADHAYPWPDGMTAEAYWRIHL